MASDMPQCIAISSATGLFQATLDMASIGVRDSQTTNTECNSD